MMSSPGQRSGQRSQQRLWSEGPLPAKRFCSPWASATETLPLHDATVTSPATSLPANNDISENDVTDVRRVTNPFLMSSDDVRGDDEDMQVFLSVMWQGGRLGLAYYDLQSTQVHMMPDTLEADDFSLLQRVISQIQPTSVVVSTRTDERLLRALKLMGDASSSSAGQESVLQRAGARAGAGDGPQDAGRDRVMMLPSIDFNLDLSKQRILSLNLPGIPHHFSLTERSLYLSSLIPFDSVNMVRALGGLLKMLDKQRVGIELEDPSMRVPVLSLHIFSLRDMMFMDDGSYSSLQIFSGEIHPSVYKAGSAQGSKEGLSLYGILNRCRTQSGSKLLRQWFLRPSRDIPLLRARQEAVAFFSSPRNAEVAASLTGCLRQIKNINRVLVHMNQAEASLSEWQALYKTAYNCIYIGDICKAQTHKVDIVKRISEKFLDDLYRIASVINKIVDFEESKSQNRFVVKPGVDAELDQKKRTYNGLPEFMTSVAREELDKLSSDIEECNVIYLPQLGYMLAIPLCDAMKEEDNYHIEGLDFVFLSNKTAHYRSESTMELDRLLGDTQCEITDHETSIMHRLQNLVLEHSQVLLDSLILTAELDCLLAFAMCARECSFVKPELTNDNVIQIKAGRHPLQELCCTPFVPNSTLSGGEHTKMKVLTGPNASGKSVYLKQVAVIVFLAQIGSFVPAEGALIGVLDAIFTRIQTVESVSVGLSTFMIDLNQVSTAIHNATGRSLVIIDEFGKGTASGDGIALLCASLKYWLEKKDDCPHIFVSTHFHSLVSENLLPKSPLLQYLTMEYLEDGEELVFLYQLVEGATNSSYACHIAAQADLPPEIVRRGREVTDLARRHQPIQRIDSCNTQAQFRRCEEIVNQFLSLDLDHADLQKFLNDTVLVLGQTM